MSDPRTRARGLSTDALARGDAVGWFEHLYREAVTGGAIVPWADLRPNPHLVDWLRQGEQSWSNALVVGCGFGDDAEYLADHGAGRVTAFDVSSTAIAEARRRFPESRVDYQVADAFDPPDAWRGSFDLIVEISTLQVLPPELRAPLVRWLVDWVAPGGTLLVVSRGRDEGDPVGELPWPLTRAEVELPVTFGLSSRRFDDVMDDETPPVRRLIGTFVRSGASSDGVVVDRGVVVGVSRRAGHGVGKDPVVRSPSSPVTASKATPTSERPCSIAPGWQRIRRSPTSGRCISFTWSCSTSLPH